MGLSVESVKIAWYILNEINPKANNSFIQTYDKEDEFKEDTIIGFDKKSDDGWENIWMNVKDITPAQIKIFEAKKDDVGNSSFMRHKINGITRIGWF